MKAYHSANSGLLLFKFIFLAETLIHLFFTGVFMILKDFTLGCLGLLFTILYLSGTLLSFYRSNSLRIYPWFLFMFLEVNGASFICTMTFGCGSSFFLYSMTALPIATYILYLSCPKNTFRYHIIFCNLITLLTEISCMKLMNRFGILNKLFPVKSIDQSIMFFLRGTNITANTALVFLFAFVFVSEMEKLFRKLNTSLDQLEYTASHDSLTGLYNRHYMDRMLDKSDSPAEQFCVVMADIDNFKRINDTYGHSCGDLVLKILSDLLHQHIRENDIAFRWGGEEFLILMHGTASTVGEQLEALRVDIESTQIPIEEASLFATVTFGLADKTEICPVEQVVNSKTIDQLIRLADKRLYQGKAAGKNKVVIK